MTTPASDYNPTVAEDGTTLQDIRDRRAKCTPGRWVYVPYPHGGQRIYAESETAGGPKLIADTYQAADQAFHADIPALLAEIERLHAYADRLAGELPEGGLPQDIELRTSANQALAQENFELRAALADYRRLIALQSQRTVQASLLFQREHDWPETKFPDLGELIEWLLNERKRMRGALATFAERDNWQIGEPDDVGATNYEWIGDGDDPFDVAAAVLNTRLQLTNPTLD